MTHNLQPSDFARWLDRYKEAWEQRDPTLAASLFSDDARYRETPFDPPIEGRPGIAAYWARVTAGQTDVRFSHQVIACARDTGVCRWRSTFTAVPAGGTIVLDGIFVCRFAGADLVANLEEWWHLQASSTTEGTGSGK